MTDFTRLDGWEYCPAGKKPTPSFYAVWHKNNAGEWVARLPEIPGDGCCEYGHQPIYVRGDDITP